MRKRFLCILFLLLNLQLFAEVRDFNNNWKFQLGDYPEAKSINYNDDDWRILDLPHDWAFENGYSKTGDQEDRGGYASGGIGWYRKNLKIKARDLSNSRYFLNFDAIYMNSEVWINEHYLGKRPYGYISFEYEITDYLNKGQNTIAVRVDNSLEPSARWYHGCGIYGNVSLEKTSLVRLKKNSLYVTTPKISKDEATVHFKADIDNKSSYNINKIDLSYSILSPDNKVVSKEKNLDINQLSEGFTACVNAPQIWDIDAPNLYTLVLKLRKGRKILAENKVRFGIREVKWDVETGFYLNGRNLKLRGVCEHLEGGPIGAAWTKDLMRWKIQLIKDMGCNSIRTAHNPQLPFFYDLCDEMGILVMDESFDGWRTKAKYDYGMQAFEEWWEEDLRTFIKRDRNHPSVVIYSVGNETRGDVASDLVRVCHEEDPTRLVTSGHSGSPYMDVLGVNGTSEKKQYIERYKPKNQAFVGTETPHTWQVRGYYRSKTWYRDGYPNKRQDPFEIPDLTQDEIFTYEWAPVSQWVNAKQHFNSSYDNATVRLTARHNIEFLRDLPWYSGSFRWTGFDYLGEAGYVHGGWPFRAFMGGALDMAGFKKDLYYLYQSEWTDEPMVHILPHWTHPYMNKGTEIPVVVYSNADEVELIVNGESFGRQKKGKSWDKMAGEWLVPWNTGKVEAIAYINGEKVAYDVHRTAQQPSELSLDFQDITKYSEREKTILLTLAENDRNGNLYPYGENRIYFSFPDYVKVLSLESGNPVDVETNWNASSKTAFFGLLRAFITVPSKEISRLKSKSREQERMLYVGAILGDKRLKINDVVTIDVKQLDLETHKKNDADVQIYYTLDGSEPTNNSLVYNKPFSISPETTVRASVYKNGKLLFSMLEKFGKNEGIAWNKKSSNDFNLSGIQAETLKHKGFTFKTESKGYEGKGYLEVLDNDSKISFYQENDGSPKVSLLKIRMHHITKTPTIEIYNNKKLVKKCQLENISLGQWSEVKLELPLESGANQLDVVLKNIKGSGVDWIKLAE